MANDIFLSYRRTDQALARELVSALEAQGLEVWWDQEIEGGEDWREAIVEGLSSAKALVILFSSHCNSSKQLKKELAIADTLDKEVIPVLIEDTQPKGHYLYELAARNWLQVHPNPETKMADLAVRLARELGTPRRDMSDLAGGDVKGGPGRESMMEGVPAAQAEAPPLSADTVEKVVEATQEKESHEKDRRDFMPFKWYELIAILGFAGLVGYVQEDPALQLYDFMMFAVLLLLAYAALVFPIRYFFRRRRVGRATRFYFLSTIPLALLTGVAATFHPEFASGQNLGDLGVNIIVGLVLLFLFSLVSFSIYGLLHFQRTMRSFKRNVETI